MEAETVAPVILDVSVAHDRDLPGAQEGGADRLTYAVPADDGVGTAPEPVKVAALVREADVPVRVMLRLNDSWTSTGGEFTRLVALGQEYVATGAEGLCFGFLDADLRIDVESCRVLAERIAEGGPAVPWTFHAGFDAALEPERAWRAVRDLPGLDAVQTAGSTRGMQHGYEDLLDAARSQRSAELMLPGRGMLGEHVPWLVSAGVRQFRLEDGQSRPGGSAKAYVDAAHVRSWRLLLDDALARVLRRGS